MKEETIKKLIHSDGLSTDERLDILKLGRNYAKLQAERDVLLKTCEDLGDSYGKLKEAFEELLKVSTQHLPNRIRNRTVQEWRERAGIKQEPKD